MERAGENATKVADVVKNSEKDREQVDQVLVGPEVIIRKSGNLANDNMRMQQSPTRFNKPEDRPSSQRQLYSSVSPSEYQIFKRMMPGSRKARERNNFQNHADKNETELTNDRKSLINNLYSEKSVQAALVSRRLEPTAKKVDNGPKNKMNK